MMVMDMTIKGRTGVEVSSKEAGAHGDHWHAILGYHKVVQLEPHIHDFISELNVGARLNDLVTHAAQYENLDVVGVQQGEYLATLFPVVKSQRTIPVEIKEVIEWDHVDGVEAQIVGVGKDTYSLNFFATDYTENKELYKQGGTLDIAMAGLAYVIDSAASMPENVADNFCAYLPNSDMPTGMDYDFIGEVLSVSESTLKNEELVHLEIRLINDQAAPDLFNLPIVTNKNNLRCEGIQVGDRLSGCFWLQGAVASSD